jgi:hypothetical protein
MRSRNTNRRRAFVVLGVVLALSALLAAIPASAEPPFASYTKPAPTSNRWKAASLGYMPYTERSLGERHALDVAQAVLTDLPWGLVRNADHGYTQCAETLAKMKLLRSATPTIVGHEIVLDAPEREARVFVYTDGIVRLISTGDTPTPADQLRQISGEGEHRAWEVAHSAMCLHAGLDPDSPYCDVAGSIAAYGVGFAAEDGTSLVIRVDHDGGISCPTW